MTKIIVNMSWLQFDSACKEIATYLKETEIEITSIYGIPKGGIIPAIRICHLLNEKPKLLLNEDEIDVHTLLIDEIIDSGSQMETLLKKLQKKHKVFSFWIATLVLNPNSKIKPDIYIYLKDKQFVNFPWEKKLNGHV